MLGKTYTITQKGIEFCPEGETFVEGFTRYESLQNEFLRLLRDTGPKTEKEIITHFTPHYEASQIKSMLKLTEYAELVTVKRTIRR